MRILKAFNNKGTKNETVDNLTIFVRVDNISEARKRSELYIITCDDNANNWRTTFTSNLETWNTIGTKMNTCEIPQTIINDMLYVFSEVTA